jgi:SAM-dependent methyltransferase
VAARRTPPPAQTPPPLALLGRAADRGALEHYEDPAYYTKTYGPRTEDVDYYVNLARTSAGPVLEYGIGNGRVAIPIARAGVQVVGIDLSEPMLESLAERLRSEPDRVRARVSPRHGDMRSKRLRRRFPLIIAPFNAILHLYEREDLERFLARVRGHLAPAARFVFDFSMPDVCDLCRDPERSYRAPRFRHPTTGELTRYAERFEYDPLRQVMLVNMDFIPEGKRPRWTTVLTHRQFFPREMEALLHYNGFTDIRWSADFTDQPPDAHTDSLVVSCRARSDRRSPRRRTAKLAAPRRRT